MSTKRQKWVSRGALWPVLIIVARCLHDPAWVQAQYWGQITFDDLVWFTGPREPIPPPNRTVYAPKARYVKQIQTVGPDRCIPPNPNWQLLEEPDRGCIYEVPDSASKNEEAWKFDGGAAACTDQGGQLSCVVRLLEAGVQIAGKIIEQRWVARQTRFASVPTPGCAQAPDGWLLCKVQENKTPQRSPLDQWLFPSAQAKESPTGGTGSSQPPVYCGRSSASRRPVGGTKGAYLGRNPELAVAEHIAAQQLGANLAKRGLVMLDPHANNLFFFWEKNQPKAGILDPQFVVKADTLRHLEPESLTQRVWDDFGWKNRHLMQDIDAAMPLGGKIDAQDLMKIILKGNGWKIDESRLGKNFFLPSVFLRLDEKPRFLTRLSQSVPKKSVFVLRQARIS